MEDSWKLEINVHLTNLLILQRINKAGLEYAVL